MENGVIIFHEGRSARMQRQRAVVLPVHATGALLVARVNGTGETGEVAADVVQSLGKRCHAGRAQAINCGPDGAFMGGEIGHAVMDARPGAAIKPGNADPYVAH